MLNVSEFEKWDILLENTQNKEREGKWRKTFLELGESSKAKGPVTNLRVITLLNTIRKVLSRLVLERTKKEVDQYLDPSQSAFRDGRSTSDVIMAHKWLIGKTHAEDIEIFITGIDMTVDARVYSGLPSG